MKRGHWSIVFIQIGIPVLLLIALNFLSPGYMRDIFLPDAGLPYFINVILACIGMNTVLLAIGFSIYISRREKRKIKNDDTANQDKMPLLMKVFLIFTFIFFTLPSIYLVIMGGAIVRISSQIG